MVERPYFDDEFATPGEYARQYRSLALQIVPGFMPGESKGPWKRPLLKQWTQYQDVLVTDEVFAPWYGPLGQYRQRPNMGFICGKASGNLFIIDLDVHKKPEAAVWWEGIMAVWNNHMPLETAEQRTGGGGRQILFYAPTGYRTPTCKTSIGVDIRGQGGFAVVAPSIHDSGAAYAWKDGLAPWDEAGIMVAPDWLLREIEKLVAEHGGDTGAPRQEHRSGAGGNGQATDGFGHATDMRELKMTELIWGTVVDWYRDVGPKMPDLKFQLAKEGEKYLLYESLVAPRLFDPALTKTQMLDREGRGPALFHVKWQYAMKHWDTKVAEEAGKPSPNKGGQNGPFEHPHNPWEEEFRAKSKVDPTTGQALPLILTDLQFTKDFKPPDYLVDSMIQKGYLYSLTGPTGHGKTPISMLMGSRVARGLPYHNKPTTQGSVLFLAGENADDIRARYIAMAFHEGFDVGAVPFYFIDGVIDIAGEMARIAAEAALIPNLSLVIIDTDQAYFLGDEGNSNEQRKWFAKVLRHLLKLPGNPAALVNCHPTKGATRDNLVPIGGSSFLNEVDGNITCWTEDRTCTIQPHASKWRGVAFEALSFELRTVTCDRLKDTKGRDIPSVMAVPITEEGAARRAAVTEEDDKAVLRLVYRDKQASLVSIARALSWFWPDGTTPAKSKVQRTIDRLKASKLVYNYHGGKYRITKKGCHVIGEKWEGRDDEE
jgi:hypothetical protein